MKKYSHWSYKDAVERHQAAIQFQNDLQAARKRPAAELIGSRVVTPKGAGELVDINLYTMTADVLIDEGEIEIFTIGQVSIERKSA